MDLEFLSCSSYHLLSFVSPSFIFVLSPYLLSLLTSSLGGPTSSVNLERLIFLRYSPEVRKVGKAIDRSVVWDVEE